MLLAKSEKKQRISDPLTEAISSSAVFLPDNWNTLNSKISKKDSKQKLPVKKKQQERLKGESYSDRVKSKIALKKTKQNRLKSART